MSIYDDVEAISHLRRNRDGEIVEQEPIPPGSYRFLVDQHGMIPDPPFPACQILDHGVPVCDLTKDDISIQWKVEVTHE